MKLKHLVFALAITNAVLYSCLLPLWEGFDEPFHFGYVESISVWHQFPVLNETPVSEQISRSLRLVPLSWLLSQAVPGSISFEHWFGLSREEKTRRERELASLSPALKRDKSDLLNYEAQQAPLAYLTLVPVDRAVQGISLRREILRLRLFGAIIATVLLYISLLVLLRNLGVPDTFQMAALACVFESQMLWASVAHVGNDWLAIALTLCFLILLPGAAARSGMASLVIITAILSAGLLTKAYFLAFIPVLAGIVIYKRARGWISWKITALIIAIPLVVDGLWYSRNLFLYHSISGTQQSAAGIGLAQVLAAIPRIPWFASTSSFVRWSLWTGNWSFVSFSRATLNLEAILLCVSFAMYLILWKRMTKGELWILAACGCFIAGLIYQTCATWIHTKGASTFPEPWYAQGVIPCIWALCFSGLAGGGIAGRIVAILLCLISAWIAEMTYIAKLLPLYGSGAYTRSTWHSVWSWWLSNPTEDLRGVVLASVSSVYGLLALFSALLVIVTAISVYKLWRPT
jgi:hypothetical protein